ncbi:MAG: hypothetical protein FWH29_02140 [Methanobrevibacter sp.]|nr:hypothetical protein [Methanobrevibacter sp.]
MKIDNNTLAIIGIIIVVIIAIIAATKTHNNEIATGLLTLGSTAIGGVIGYLAKSQTFENGLIGEKIDVLKNNVDVPCDEKISNNTDEDIKNMYEGA